LASFGDKLVPITTALVCFGVTRGSGKNALLGDLKDTSSACYLFG